MAKIPIEEIVIFVIMVQMVTPIIFGMNLQNSYYPNQRWNSTSESLEYYVPDPSYSIMANTLASNDTMARYGNASNTSVMNPGNLISQLGIVGMIGFYFDMIIGVISGGYLNLVLTPWIGAEFSHLLVAIINLMTIIFAIHLITGRVRWS